MSPSLLRLKTLAHDTGRWFIRLVVGSLLFAIGVGGLGYAGARWYFWPRLDSIATARVGEIERRVGAPVAWQSIATDWEGLRPSVDVRGLAIGTGDGAIRVERAVATLSLVALMTGRSGLHDLRLDRPVLPLVRDGGGLRVAALAPSGGAGARGSGAGDTAAALAAVTDLRVGEATVLVSGGDGADRRFERVDLVMKSRGRLHEFRLDVGAAPGLAGPLHLEGDVLRPRWPDDDDWRRWDARARLRGAKVQAAPLLAEALRVAPALLERLPGVRPAGLGGELDVDLTLDFRNGRFDSGRVALLSDALALPLPPAPTAPAAPTRSSTSAPPKPIGPVAPPTSRAAGAPPAPAGDVLALTRLALDLRWRHQPDGTLGVELPTLLAQGADGFSVQAQPSQSDASFDAASGELQRIALRLDHAELAPLLAVARRVAPGPALARISTLAGRASATAFDWRVGEPWRTKSAFERLSLALTPTERELARPDKPRLPGVARVAGNIEATAHGGYLQLRGPQEALRTGQGAAQGASRVAAGAGGAAAASAVLRLDGALMEPEVELSELDAALRWRLREAQGLPMIDVDIERFRFANADLAGRLEGRFVDEPNAPGAVDLTASLDRGAARRLWRYLPRRLPSDVRNWARGAFESGRIEQLSFRLNGPLDPFPYRGADAGKGEFRVDGRFRDVLLSAAPGWPALHRSDGEFRIERAALQFSIDKAEVPSATIGPVRGRIADLGDATLELEGRAEGDADAFVRYVNASPLVADLGALTRPLKAEGPTALALRLVLPIGDAPRERAAPSPVVVDGSLQFDGATLAFVEGLPPLHDVRGTAEFRADSLRLAGVQARLLDEPVVVDAQTLGEGRTRVSLAGGVSAKGLRTLSDDPLTRRLQGSTTFSAAIEFDRVGMRLSLDSDLAGLGSALPAPLAKPAAAAWPLRIDVVPAPAGKDGGPAQRDRIEASLGGAALRLIAQRDRASQRRSLQVTRAAIASNRAPTLPAQGLAIQYVGQRIDVDAWRAVFEPGAGDVAAGAEHPSGDGAFAPAFSAIPTEVSIRAGSMRIFDRDLNAVDLSARRRAEHWTAQVRAQELVGAFDWDESALRNREGRLVARFGRLEIPKSQREAVASLLQAGPRTLPALDITAETLVLGGANLGRLELLATNHEGTWSLDTLRLGSPAAQFEATGRWREQTELDFRLRMGDVGALLAQLDFEGVVRDGKGELSGQLRWRGSPLGLDPASLSGRIELAVREGQFLKVEPGAAKLIGVLNLQALPKLMSLDFRDLFAQGFSFDELRGSAAIAEGIARTDSLAMRGLQAVVQIKGQADLARATQDLTVTVLPELNGGLASLAYAAIINPAVGLGAFLAQSILSPSLSRALAYEIDIKGSWSDPEVTQRKRERIGPPQGQ
ncbi:MAG: YhdP family protein [Lautropia sp.]